MKRLSRLLLPAAAVLATLLCPSCVGWRIGENIRETTRIHTSVDIAHPRDGVVYSSMEPLPEGLERYWVDGDCLGQKRSKGVIYACLPEREYRVSSATLVWAIPYCDSGKLDWKQHSTRLTGRYRWVAVKGKSACLLPEDFKTLPADARRLRLPKGKKERQPDFCPVGTHGSAWHIPACIAAAPFDYVIDPALSAVSTTGLWLAAFVSFPFHYLADACSQPQDATPSSEQAQP